MTDFNFLDRPSRTTSLFMGLLLSALAPLGCADDSTQAETSGTSDTGDGDGDSDTETSSATGDGDGDTTGDGDGDTTGDGDGDTTGDGDGDTTGDGDGDTTGDGDGDTTGDGDGDGDCLPDEANGVGPCDQFFGWAWDGAECVSISGCECNGPDCDGLPLDLAVCEAAHADCDLPPPPDGCAALTEDECLADDLCMPANGAELIELDMGFCMDPPGFVGCIDAGLCGQAFTWGCGPMNVAYLFPTTCLPEGFALCMPADPDAPPC